MQRQASFFRRIFPLSGAGFFGVFNDNAFKMVFVLAVLGAERNYFSGMLFLLLLTAFYAVPALLFLAPAGFLADRFPKRYTMLLSKFLETLILIFGAFALHFSGHWGLWPLAGAMVLLSVQNAFFTPAFLGVLPEVFHEHEISHANGTISAISFLAAAAGIAFPVAVRFCFGGSFLTVIVILAGCSVLGFFLSAYVTQTISVVQMHREMVYPFCSSIKKSWCGMIRTPGLLLAALGDALFMALGFAVLLLLGFFARYSLPESLNEPDLCLLYLAPMCGIALGSYIAGRISSRKIELGLVPFGAAGVALFLLLGAYFPGRVTFLSLSIPNLFSADLKMFTLASLFFFLAGVNGGLFLVPLRAYFQQRVKPGTRGAALAASNALCFLTILVLNLLTLLLALGAAKDSSDLPVCLRSFVQHLPAIPPAHLLTALGIITALVTFVSMWILPDFALRFLIITLGNIFYKVRATGTSNIPERGPALLLANHVSYIDSILICSCTSRHVRFLMHEDFFSKPVLSWIARLTGFIKVPSAGKYKSLNLMFEEVREALRNGEIVCVYPEGRPTRNGIIGRFASGFERMMPPELDVPLIPVNIGRIWGSIFSHAQGPLRFRLPKEFPYFTTLTIGERLPKGISAFDVRQRVAELSAESAMLPAPNEHPIHHLLARNAKHHPFHVIIRDAADGKSFTFFKTYLASILFSREIRKLTPCDSKYVGVLLPNCTASVLSIFGVLLADKVPCPLNFTTPQEVLELSIRKAEMKLVLTSRRFLDKLQIRPIPEMVFLEDIAKRVPMWKKIMTLLGIIFLPYKELLNMIAPLSQDDNFAEAALLFSSGSTGIPKGVRLTHHNLYSDVFAMIQAIRFNSKKDSIFGNLPLFHSFGMTTGIWIPFIVRSQAVVFVNSPLDAYLTGESIAKYKVTVLLATPSFLQMYLRKFKPEYFDSLRLVISGAEKLRQDIIRNFRERLHGRLEIVEGYGCTELSPVATINLAEDILDTGKKSGKTGAIGLGMETFSTRIMDPLTFKPVPPDTEGLLFVKSPTVMMGYLHDPEQTSKVILNGYYNTGDIAKMDEYGYITICGRLSRFSKIAGEMVPHEMVECIINEMCGLEEAVVAVAGIPDPQKGEALLVFYTPAMPYTPSEIVDQLRERSISNLWIPKAQNFHPIERLPMLGSGKLDLTVLRHLADQVAEERRKAMAARERNG